MAKLTVYDPPMCCSTGVCGPAVDPVLPRVTADLDWLKRQPRFDLTLLLHEDWEANGFYLYELNPTARPSLAAAMIEAVRPVCAIDTATTIDGRPIAEPGIIRPTDDQSTFPTIAPLIEAHWEPDMAILGGRLRLDGSAVALTR